MSIATFLTKLTKVKPIAWVIETCITLLGKVKWYLPKHDRLTNEDVGVIRSRLGPHYYLIVTHRRNHLSSYMVALGNFFLTGKFSFWSHVLMNLENEVKSDDDFRLVEAVSAGVRYSAFDEVFNCNAVALLKPKSLRLEEWTNLLDEAAARYVGRRYDSLFDITDDTRLSCVELVREMLRTIPTYSTDFANLEAMIQSRKNLTPTMFYDCPDFEVVWEVRR